MVDTLVTNNPYVGPRSIKTGEAFFGRDREIRSLSALLIAERIVLLHSPSGAGKSSLIQAGLLPLLVERFSVFPLVRVNLDPPEDARGIGGLNRYVLSTLLSLEEARPAAEHLPVPQLAALTLEAYLEQRALSVETSENILLLFDQFEEVLTVSSTDGPAKQEFFEQLGEALQNRQRWALFAIREDYMGGLAPYVRAIPNRLSVPFRLGLLGPQAAKLSIQQPARDQGVEFTDEAAQKLVDDLRRIQVQQTDGSFITEQGAHVEPVQLQVVCYNLWQSHAADDKIIDENDLQRVGSVDQALASYYAKALGMVTGSARLDERILRQWIDEHLITADGLRSQVMKGVEASAGLPNIVLRLLQDTHLVRGETRAGKTWYELSHDRLVGPVRQDNSAWFAQNLSLLQRQSVLWNQKGRLEGLLLRGKELAAEEQKIHSLEMTADEQAFLEACQGLRKREKRDVQQKRFILGGLITSLALLVISVTGFLRANQQTRVAQTAEGRANLNASVAETAVIDARLSLENSATAMAIAVNEKQHAFTQAFIARAGELSSYSVNQADKSPTLSLLLGIEAFNTADILQSRSVLLDNIQKNPQLLKYLSGQTADVRSVAFSPDGKTLAVGNKDNIIMLWSTVTGRQIGSPFTANTDYVVCLAFSPDGKTLGSGSTDSKILLWDVETGQSDILSIASGPWIVSLAFSPDGKTLASGKTDHTISLWDLATRKETWRSYGHSASVYSLAFSPDGKILASGSEDKTILLSDTQTGQPIFPPLAGHTDTVSSLAFSPDGSTLASGSADKTILLWNVKTGKLFFGPLSGHTEAVTSVAFSPDGAKLASGGRDKSIIVWNLVTGEPIGKSLKGHTDRIFSVVFNPLDGGKTLISSSADKSIIHWDVPPRLSIGQGFAENSTRVLSVAFSPDGRTLATGGENRIISLWNMATRQVIDQPLMELNGEVTSLGFSPDGRTLAAGGYDNNITLWDVATALPIGEPLAGHTGYVASVAFSPDGKTLASASDDQTIILWDVATHHPIGQPLTLHTGKVSSVVFSPDGSTLASGSWDATILLWEVATRQPIGQPLTGHTGKVSSVVFSLDGSTLASASYDQSIILWNAATHQRIGQPLSGHTAIIFSVAFSPDGKMLASGSWDGSILLWDVATRQPIGQPLIGHSGDVNGVVFSPDGKTLASAGYDRRIILWDLDPQSLIEKSCQRANRNFTRAEWDKYFPNQAYRATCPLFGLEGQAVPGP
jgi:WD40 repeat protein